MLLTLYRYLRCVPWAHSRIFQGVIAPLSVFISICFLVGFGHPLPRAWLIVFNWHGLQLMSESGNGARGKQITYKGQLPPASPPWLRLLQQWHDTNITTQFLALAWLAHHGSSISEIAWTARLAIVSSPAGNVAPPLCRSVPVTMSSQPSRLDPPHPLFEKSGR